MVLLKSGCYYSDFSVYPSNWQTCARKALVNDWYIQYRYYDPRLPKVKNKTAFKQVFIKTMNKFVTLEERREYTRNLLLQEEDKLNNKGYNPFTKTYDSHEGISIAQQPVASIIPSNQANPSSSVPSLTSSSSIPPTINNIEQEQSALKIFQLPEEYDISPDTPFITALEKIIPLVDCVPTTKDNLRSVLKYSRISAEVLGMDKEPIQSITSLYIRVLLAQLKKDKGAFTARTFNYYRSHLMMMFKALLAVKIIKEDPVESLIIQKHAAAKRQVLTIKERSLVDKFLRINNYRFWVVVNLFFHSGIRRTELANLKGSDVNLDRLLYRTIVRKGTNYREVYRPIKKICDWLWRYALEDCEPDQYIFSKGLKPGDKPIRPEQFTRRWKRWVKNKLGIEADFYSLKHLNTDEISERLDLAHAATLNSQNSIKVAKIYAVGEEKRKMIRIQGVGNSFAPITEIEIKSQINIEEKEHEDYSG